MRHVLIFGLVILIFLKSTKGDEVEIEKPICREKEKSKTFLNIAEDLVFNIKTLCPKRKDTHDAAEELGCTRKETYSNNYLKIIKKLINDIREGFPSCLSERCSKRPLDCSDVMAAGSTKSGKYTIFPMSKYTGLKAVEAYCDMDTEGGGWTVIQRRGNFTPQTDFYRYWKDFKIGFGDVEKEFWLGNDNIYALSNQRPVEIRIELEYAEGNRRYASYSEFKIEDEKKSYTLRIRNYTGDAGDGMSYHNRKEFSTKDRGNTGAVTALKGAWWMTDWAMSHLNGLYLPGKDDPASVHWYKWKNNTGLSFTEMKVRPVEL